MKKRQRGTTLVELILYIALISIFMGGAITFAWDIIYSRVKSNTQRIVSQNLRLVSERLSYELRNATSVSIPNATTLTLTNSTPSRSPTTFLLSGGRIAIVYGSTCPAPPETDACFLTSNELTISNLTFTDTSASGSTNVTFSVTGTSTADVSEYNASETYTSSVELRI